MKSRFLKLVIERKSILPFGRIIVLTGARQTGKTTLAQQCFPDFKYLSIEDPILRIQYSKLTAAQWLQFYPNAILDEVQKEPKLIESIKSVYDQYPEPKYLLLGSSQLLLLNKVKESLAGRCTIQEVFPLTIPEINTSDWNEVPQLSVFQSFLKENKLPEFLPSFELYNNFAKRVEVFEYYLTNGGYPALVNPTLNNDDRFDWLCDYVRTYLERDVRDLADFKSLDPFVQVQKMTSILTGQLVNFSYLGKNAGVSSKTAQRFIQYLEISYQTILLRPWHSNELKRLVKSPKLHYLDPGVQKAILQKRGELTGNEFESAIIAEIYKQTKVIEIKASFYHLRTHDGAEIDLLIELTEGFIPIEIKMSNYVSKSEARHLLNIEKILNKPIIHCFLISRDNQIKKISDKITALPASMFLS